MAVHKYIIYGLGVRSEIPLWGECLSDCPNDVAVRWARRATSDAGSGAASPARDATGDEIRLRWPDVCEMSIRSGAEIVVCADADCEVSHLRHLVSGIGLGLALYQRGVFTLHAGAVSIGGRAIAFAGPKGAGKSTLVAALSARGHALLSDDVVALDLPADGAPRVRIGAPNMNLWPDSAAAAGYDLTRLSRICAHSPKLVGTVADGQPPEPVPLGAIVFLSGEEGLAQCERLSPLDAFPQLVGHTHAFRWVERSHDLRHHLSQCHAVLSQVPVFRLARGRSLDSLPSLVQEVEQSIAAAWSYRPARRWIASACP